MMFGFLSTVEVTVSGVLFCLFVCLIGGYIPKRESARCRDEGWIVCYGYELI